jgi:phosphotransferase system HPr-like phosphotransfer protein
MRKGIFQLFGLYRDAKVQIAITDPRGLHMRRCKDLVLAARKFVAYRIFIRNVSAQGKTWINAKSILSLQALGIRGHRNGEPLPVIELKVSGFRPRPVLQEIRKVLEEDPHKYLSVYELAELAKETGGNIMARLPESPATGLRQRLARALRRSLGRKTG